MTCAECLSALETESLRDMAPDSPVMLHCARCPDCARVTTTLRDKEYETATVLNSLPPMSSPLTVAETAVRTAQRRRVGRVAVAASGAAFVVTLWIVVMTIVLPAFEDDMRGAGGGGGLRTETIALSCLSPQQAGEIVDPYVRSERGAVYTTKSGIAAITVRGTAEELAKSRDLIRKFEDDPSAACRLPATTLGKPEGLLRVQRAAGMLPDVAPDKAPTSLLGPGKSLLDKGPPSGSGPVTGSGKATTPTKKK